MCLYGCARVFPCEVWVFLFVYAWACVAQVVAGDVLLLPQLLLHHNLGGNASVVAAGIPQRGESLHAVPVEDVCVWVPVWVCGCGCVRVYVCVCVCVRPRVRVFGCACRVSVGV